MRTVLKQIDQAVYALQGARTRLAWASKAKHNSRRNRELDCAERMLASARSCVCNAQRKLDLVEREVAT